MLIDSDLTNVVTAWCWRAALSDFMSLSPHSLRVCVCTYPPPLVSGMREHPPVAICDLADHIDRLKANDNLRFSQEYEVTLPALLRT